MRISQKEVVLLLSGDEFLNEQAKAYARTLSLPVNIQEQAEQSASSTIYQLVVDNSDHDPKDLVDHTAPEYEEEVQGHELDENSWVKLLHKHPKLLRVPIAVRGEKVVILDAPSKIQRLDG